MNNNVLILVARVLLAVLFVVSGLGKLADPSGVAAMLGAIRLPAPTLLA